MRTTIPVAERELGFYLIAGFMENERRHHLYPNCERPLTDDEMLLSLAQVIPNSTCLKAIVQRKYTLNHFRNLLNQGRYYRHQPPLDPPSFRYNKHNQRVSGRSERVVLTEKRQLGIISRLAATCHRLRSANNADSWEEVPS